MPNDYSAIFLCGTPDEDTRTLILFPTEYYDKAQEASEKAHEQYWDSNNPHYYEWGWNDYVEHHLNELGVPHSIISMDDFQYLLPEEYFDFGELSFFNYLDYLEKNCVKFRSTDDFNIHIKV